MTVNKFNPLPKPSDFRVYSPLLLCRVICQPLGKLMSLWWIFLVCAFFASLHVIAITIEAQPYYVFVSQASIEEETVAPAISILASLLQYNQDIRQALAADVSSILTLLRCEFPQHLSVIHSQLNCWHICLYYFVMSFKYSLLLF